MPPAKVRKAPEVLVFEDPDAKIRDSIHRKDKLLKVCILCFFWWYRRRKVLHPPLKLWKDLAWKTTTTRLSSFVISLPPLFIHDLAKSALTGREKNEYELTKLGAIVFVFRCNSCHSVTRRAIFHIPLPNTGKRWNRRKFANNVVSYVPFFHSSIYDLNGSKSRITV